MKIGKIICCAALGALALSAIPYQFKNDEETGAVEIRSLLWGWRRTPNGDGEGKDSITFAIPAITSSRRLSPALPHSRAD